MVKQLLRGGGWGRGPLIFMRMHITRKTSAGKAMGGLAFAYDFVAI